MQGSEWARNAGHSPHIGLIMPGRRRSFSVVTQPELAPPASTGPHVALQARVESQRHFILVKVSRSTHSSNDRDVNWRTSSQLTSSFKSKN